MLDFRVQLATRVHCVLSVGSRCSYQSGYCCFTCLCVPALMRIPPQNWQRHIHDPETETRSFAARACRSLASDLRATRYTSWSTREAKGVSRHEHRLCGLNQKSSTGSHCSFAPHCLVPSASARQRSVRHLHQHPPASSPLPFDKRKVTTKQSVALTWRSVSSCDRPKCCITTRLETTPSLIDRVCLCRPLAGFLTCQSSIRS